MLGLSTTKSSLNHKSNRFHVGRTLILGAILALCGWNVFYVMKIYPPYDLDHSTIQSIPKPKQRQQSKRLSALKAAVTNQARLKQNISLVDKMTATMKGSEAENTTHFEIQKIQNIPERKQKKQPKRLPLSALKAVVRNQARLNQNNTLVDEMTKTLKGPEAENTSHFEIQKTLGELEKAKADPSNEISFQVSQENTTLVDETTKTMKGSEAENTSHFEIQKALGEHEKVKADPSDEISFQASQQCRNFDHTIRTPYHGCQVNQNTYLVYCNFNNLQVDKTKISSDQGGEPLDKVMGRGEEREFPQYQKGAFTVPTPPKFEGPPQYRSRSHYLFDVLNNMVYPTNETLVDMKCDQTWSGVTLFITRYEYVNLYHTMTDWWNAYSVLPPNEKVRLVFLDAHAQGNLDPVWSTMFGEYTFVQHLPANSVCFERAIFIPPGYLSPLFPAINLGRRRCPYPPHAKNFTNHVLESYHLQNVRRIPGKIVIIDRKPYVAHPRSAVGKLPRVIPNLSELRSKLIQLDQVTSVEIVHFENVTFAEQVQTVRQAHILIGNHGAGLSHVLFMDRKSHLLEFTVSQMYFFEHMSEFAQIQHHLLYLRSAENLLPSEMQSCISTVQRILDG